jgi:hypothetical protein
MKTMKKVILHLLVLVPIASVSFAAQAALKMDFVGDYSTNGSLDSQDPRPPHGPHESVGS